MKKLLDSDQMRAVQINCNTCAKSVKLLQITHCNSGFWFAEIALAEADRAISDL